MQSGIKVQQKLRLLNWRRVVSFTLKALELEMQSGIISRTGEELFLLRWKLSNWTRVVSFTLKALELEMQSGIKVQQAEALELEKRCFFYSEGSRTGKELFLLLWRLSN